ncbi:hypothetical protein Patl1_08235 [Pistacia atlantica]|uniref:Uncharacterized protein n=1 Tax=Pistacia atlantica TaxID=434234 RepID=A0ACC1AKA6_9ROSI|nr:hypothetical protein Patl1_08235 [Pistacia atlantica]
MGLKDFVVATMASVLVAVATKTLAITLAKSGCPGYCGNVAIPYPFGTSPDCFRNENFRITCNNSFNPPKPYLRDSNIDFTNISIDGELQIPNFVARDCFTENESEDQNHPALTLSDFTISSTKNVFTVIGCDSYAYIQGYIDDQRYSSGCMSLCDSSKYVKDGSCIGSGCCQIEIPRGLSEINITAYSFNNHVNVSDFNPCTYAFVVDKSSFTFNRSYLDTLPKELPVVLEWTVTGEGNCTEASSKPYYACKENSECYEPDNGSGYLCKCKKGYRGNPYLSNGCEGTSIFLLNFKKNPICQGNSINTFTIDNECNEPNLNNCEQKCDNTEGSYTCSCYKGYHLTDGGKDGPRCVPNVPNQFPVIKIALNPEYFQTGQLTEKSDVYSFGVVLVELLTGKKAVLFDKSEGDQISLVTYFLSSMEENRLFQILENHIVNDENKEQLREMAELAKRCLSVKGEERPRMREVAMELHELRMMHKHPWDSAMIPEETESFLFGTSGACRSGDDRIIIAGYDSIKAQAVAFDVDAR